MKVIAILVCKLLVLAGKLVRRGSSLPGKVALRLCPDILTRLRLPGRVVAVTGSNGKTSTVEMIAAVLAADGQRVVWNREGSNQIEGVATLLLKNAGLSGRVRGDVVVLESDERYARYTFKYVKPTHFVVTNLYRDQLTRNGHPFLVYDAIAAAAALIPEATLLLNADDPIISGLAAGREQVRWFGMAENALSAPETDALYNDCFYCPHCGEKLGYKFFHYSHLGDFFCENCGFSRHQPDFEADALDLENRRMTVNGQEIRLAFASRYNVYNLCAAYAICAMLGVPGEQIAASLSDFIMKNGRVVRFRAGENTGLLITSKHENSTSYNRSLEYVAAQPGDSTLVVLVDAISRKYYTADTSWLWDISFELLAGSGVRRVLLCGKYAYDLAARFSVIDLGDTAVETVPELDEMGRLLREPMDGALYAVTCFSDKGKLFDRVELLPETEEGDA